MFPSEVRVCFDSWGLFGRTRFGERITLAVQRKAFIQRALDTRGRVYARDESWRGDERLGGGAVSLPVGRAVAQVVARILGGGLRGRVGRRLGHVENRGLMHGIFRARATVRSQRLSKGAQQIRFIGCK